MKLIAFLFFLFAPQAGNGLFSLINSSSGFLFCPHPFFSILLHVAPLNVTISNKASQRSGTRKKAAP